MELTGIIARIARLNALALALAKEHATVQTANDPLLYRERQNYLAAIRAALEGIESARLCLVAAKKRLVE